MSKSHDKQTSHGIAEGAKEVKEEKTRTRQQVMEEITAIEAEKIDADHRINKLTEELETLPIDPHEEFGNPGEGAMVEGQDSFKEIEAQNPEGKISAAEAAGRAGLDVAGKEDAGKK